MKKVSVIVPAYNAEKYLKKCLDSLIGQTLEEIEIVVVDDGSTDATSDILKEYQVKNPDKLKVFTKENGGQASARNLALSFCEGEYIGFVDADDYADQAMFERMYAKAKESNYDLVVCDHYNEHGAKISYQSFGDYADAKDMFKDVLVSPWNKLVAKRILDTCGVIFPEGYIYEDTAWFMELIPFIHSIGYVKQPLLHHVIQKNSTMTAKQNERTAQIFPVMDHILLFYKEKGFYEEYEKELEYFYVRILLCSSLKRIARVSDRKLKKALMKQTLKEIYEKFPGYRKNNYLTGAKGMYMKSVNRFTIRIYSFLFGLRRA